MVKYMSVDYVVLFLAKYSIFTDVCSLRHHLLNCFHARIRVGAQMDRRDHPWFSKCRFIAVSCFGRLYDIFTGVFAT